MTKCVFVRAISSLKSEQDYHKWNYDFGMNSLLGKSDSKHNNVRVVVDKLNEATARFYKLMPFQGKVLSKIVGLLGNLLDYKLLNECQRWDFLEL